LASSFAEYHLRCVAGAQPFGGWSIGLRMLGGTLPTRWSADELQRWQEAIDQARLNAKRRASLAAPAGSPELTASAANRATAQEADTLDEPIPDLTSARKRKSVWTPGERARLQAALDGVHRGRLADALASGRDESARVSVPADQRLQSVPLSGRPWTDNERERVQAALAELRASRLAAARVRADRAEQTSTALRGEGSKGASEASGRAEHPDDTLIALWPIATPSAAGTTSSGEFERLFGSKAPDLESTFAGPEDPVLVTQSVAPISPQEFMLPTLPAQELLRWYGPNESVEVYGLCIPGLVQVALKFQPGGREPHPATIAAWMPAELSAAANGIEPFRDSWSAPSFGSLTVAQRGLYLKWLASGRAFDVPAPLAHLYIYGLESRVVEAGLAALVEEERKAIAVAARDLVARFGGAVPSLREHGLKLAGFLDAAAAPPCLYLAKVPELAETFEVPALLQVAIGQAARDGASLPADWALACVLCDLRVAKRTPVRRCPEELSELFSLHFKSAFPNGLRVRCRAASTLTVTYRGMPDPRTGSSTGTSGIVASAAQTSLTESQIASLRTIVDQCADELSAYSRLIGRLPEARGTPDAEVRLPPVLLRRRLARSLTSLIANSAECKEVAWDQAWMTLWGTLAERKDSAPFLREFLKSEGLTVVSSAPPRTALEGQTSTSSQPFRLDPARLEQVRQDEAAAAKLLAALFADPLDQPGPARQPTEHDQGARALLPQLDDDHFQLLMSMLNRDAWSREEMKMLASQHGLMLEGALEVINDAVLELTYDLLVTNDGDLEVDLATTQRLREALAAPMQDRRR
jgi:hypothetical protein